MKDTKVTPDKIPDKATVIEWLRDGEVQLPPLAFKLVEAPTQSRRRIEEYDALLDISWKGRQYRFAVDYRQRSTPKVFDEALAQLGEGAPSSPVHRMLIVPYLSPAQLARLEERNTSGVDLCGNGIVIVPGKLCIVRAGQRNRYPQSDPIKNIYRGASSIVPRVFLVRPRFPSIGEIAEEVQRRDGRVAVSTISKAVATLEQDLIVSREAGTRRAVRLIQPDKLLEELSRNYRQPRVERRVAGESDVSLPALMRSLADQTVEGRFRCVLTGLGSIGQYAVMAREPKLQAYCTNLRLASDVLGDRFRETQRFANVELFETKDEFAYFDRRMVDGIPWSSPVQAFLELMSGDKRDYETAGQIRDLIT